MNTNYTINVEADFYGTGYPGPGKLSPSSDASNLRDFSPYQPSTYETFPIMVETKGCKFAIFYFFSPPFFTLILTSKVG